MRKKRSRFAGALIVMVCAVLVGIPAGHAQSGASGDSEAAVSGQEAAHEHRHGRGRDDSAEGVRLLLGEADAVSLYVLDAASGEVIARFDTPGPASVHQLPDPRYALAVHREADRVTVVHSGLSSIDHGDHADLVEGSPYVLATLNLGRQPTHVFARGTDLAVFNDRDGTAAWLDTRLLGISLEYVEIAAPMPDHGALAVLDGHLVVGLISTGEAYVFDRDGREVARFEGCPDLHGQAALDTSVTFGCSDGVLIVRAVGDGEFEGHKVDNPAGSPEGARVSSVAAGVGSAVLVGNFGDGIAVIDPVAGSLTAYPMPAAQVAGRFFEGGRLYAHLGADGHLRSVDPDTGEVLAAIQVAEKGVEAGRPTLAVLEDRAYVTDPGHGALRVIDLESFAEIEHFDLPFTPSGVAVLAIPGAVAH